MEQTLNMNSTFSVFYFSEFYITMPDTVVAFWYFPLVFFFCLIFICETVIDLWFSCFSLSHFISFTYFVPGHRVLCHQIPTNPLFIFLSQFSLSQVLISEHLSSPLSSHHALCQFSTRAEVCNICQHVSARCAQSVLKNLIRSVVLLWSMRAAFLNAYLHLLFLHLQPYSQYFTFIPLLTFAILFCLFTLHMVVLCLVLLLGAFPAIHRTT